MAKISLSDNAKEARHYFYERYKMDKPLGRGRPYNASFQKDGVLFNHLAGRFPISWIKGLIDFYLQWDDEFAANSGYTVGVFYHKMNQMLELNVQKSDWVRNHERQGMMSISSIMSKINKEINNGG